MRLLQKEAKKDDADPKALSCYGLSMCLSWDAPGCGLSMVAR